MSHSFLILPSGSPVLKNGDVHYPFRVDSDFLAWTHLEIEGAYFVWDMQAKDGVLFYDEPPPEKVLWEGPGKDIPWIRAQGFGDEIRPLSELNTFLERSSGEVFLSRKRIPTTREAYVFLETLLSWRPTNDADPYLIDRRLRKTPSEISKIQKAIEVTQTISEDLRSRIQPGMFEYEIEAYIAYQFRRSRGVEAFPSIVAGGPSACTLHYTAHDRMLSSWELLLVDFGIELSGYGADISRTFPVSGVFSSRQQELMDGVLRAQNYAASILRPGITRRTWNLEMKEYMQLLCVELWLLDVGSDPLQNPYFPHSIGHFLGLDTHDVGSSDIPLWPGMVMTIEPGIYIPEEALGIRIEDDYLITEEGCRRL